MVAGALSQAGYFMGEELWPAQIANPKGFFEDREVNSINEDILAQVIPRRHTKPPRPWQLRKFLWNRRPVNRQRWLACIPVRKTIPSTPALDSRIQTLVAKAPYCLKDPRFSYTLPVWRPFLGDATFVCVFRYPALAAQSILNECAHSDYLKSLSMSFKRALLVWELMYSHILQKHANDGDWLFLHFDQVLNGDGLDRLEEFLGAPVDRSFPDPAFRRTTSDDAVPKSVRLLYQQLCARAAYTDPAH